MSNKIINNILNYDFDFFNTLLENTKNAYYEFCDNPEIYSLLDFNDTITNITKDKIKKDFIEKIKQIIKIENYHKHINLNDAIYSEWNDLFLHIRERQLFTSYTFLLSYPDKLNEWFLFCKKTQNQENFGLILKKYFEYEQENDKYYDVFNCFLNNSSLFSEIDNFIDFLIKRNKKNHEKINDFINEQIILKFFISHDNIRRFESSQDFDKKHLDKINELHLIMENHNMTLDAKTSERIKYYLHKKIGKENQDISVDNLSQSLKLLFTLQSISTTNMLHKAEEHIKPERLMKIEKLFITLNISTMDQTKTKIKRL